MAGVTSQHVFSSRMLSSEVLRHRCRVLQVGETEPFICELLTTLTAIILDLQTHQIHMFYEAVGLMIAAETDAQRRDAYLVRARTFLPKTSPLM